MKTVTVPRIRTDEDLEWAHRRIEALIGTDEGTAEHDELHVLLDLAESYENRHYPFEPATPLQIVLGVMRDRDLKAKDLVSYFGAQPRVSEFLAGKRSLSIDQIRRLSEGLGIPAGALIGKAA